MTSKPSNRPALARALVIAALFLGLTAALKLAPPGFIDAELGQRLVGIMMGAIVVVYANAVPKMLTPLAELRCSPAQEQAMRRFMGISLVLGGIGYALAWMLAPIELANALGVSALALATLLAGLRYAALRAGRAPD